jgi:hypothetical protein
MPSRRVPRGQRINKPVIPNVQLGQPMEFVRDEQPITGYVSLYPYWTHDGYWELEVEDEQYHKHTMVWNPKKEKWIYKPINW